ncbi:MAG: ABC transporter ATP-binding protein [Bifidobacteriaceae bacterium]|nr:ABC transporter ATP-binding protein [Bifidobacteriaceae bacterium]
MIELREVSYQYRLGGHTETAAHLGLAPPSAAGQLALDRVSLRVAPGQFVALCGPSGCGKTTLTRLINGLVPHYYEGDLSGLALVAGLEPAKRSLWELPVGSVFQNPRTQFFTTDVCSEIAFGPENLGLPAPKIQERVDQAIVALRLRELRDRSVFALSGGEKQRLACASVAAARPDVYVLDEPSANLDSAATDQLRQTMALWKRSGATVVVAEHRLGYLSDLADRVVVLRDGRIEHDLEGAAFRSLSQSELRGLGLRATVSPEFSAPGVDALAPADGKLVIGNLVCRYGARGKRGPSAGQPGEALRIERLAIPKGQVSAVLGANGAGKTTLLSWLAGLRKAESGSLAEIGGGAPNSPSESGQAGGQRTKGGRAPHWTRKDRLERAFLVLQDVNHQLFAPSVAEEVALALRFSSNRAARANRRTRAEGAPAAERPAISAGSRNGAAALDDLAAAILAELDLAGMSDRHPLSLSAGQKQRVALAVAMASGRELVILDEPTSGLDLTHLEAVGEALRRLAETGKTVVVATHDPDLAAVCADNIIRLRGGRLA